MTEEGWARFQAAAKAHIAFVRKTFLRLYSETELQQMAEFWKRLEAQTG